MNRIRAAITAILLVVSVILLTGTTSCSHSISDNKIILTLTDNTPDINKLQTIDNWKYTGKSEIVFMSSDDNKSAEPLTKEFFSACSPSVSFDGTKIIFSGKKSENDSWQIWQIVLKSKELSQITKLSGNSTDPSWLPGERILFSHSDERDSLKSEGSVWTISSEGKDLRRITFNPYKYYFSQVLLDGRVVTIGNRVYPDRTQPYFLVMRPDGTKADLFYKSPEGKSPVSKIVETGDGRLVFVEATKGSEKTSLVSLSYNRPLHTRTELPSPADANYITAAKGTDNNVIAAAFKNGTKGSVLVELVNNTGAQVKTIYSSNDKIISDIAVCGVHEKPRKLPSEVDMGVKTGLLMSQNINILANTIPGDIKTTGAAKTVKIEGLDSLLGIVNVANDGSFYLKVLADKPFRLSTYDEKDKLVAGPGEWLWLRPNERRGCVGCHQDPELVPDNIVPVAVRQAPVNIPMHINKVVEKKVSLE